MLVGTMDMVKIAQGEWIKSRKTIFNGWLLRRSSLVSEMGDSGGTKDNYEDKLRF